MSPIPKVALLLETSREYGRQLLRGIMRYARLYGRWSFVVSPGHFEQQLPTVQGWGGDGVIDVVAQEDRTVAAMLRFIRDNAGRAGRPIQVPDVVAQTELSRRSLERRFSAAMGRTILDELTRCRLERAKRLLLETDLSVDRVALAAGFSATKPMTRAFRRFENTLPHLYRRSSR